MNLTKKNSNLYYNILKFLIKKGKKNKAKKILNSTLFNLCVIFDKPAFFY